MPRETTLKVRWAGLLVLVEAKRSIADGVFFGSIFQNLKIFVTFDPLVPLFLFILLKILFLKPINEQIPKQ